MYRIYYTDPETLKADAVDSTTLHNALVTCRLFRKNGMIFVTMVSDYHNMVGKPGASGTESNYVPQMLN